MTDLLHNNILTIPDVLVIGGGSAGVAVAVAAAEAGVSVVLLEKNAFLGGKATTAYVGTVCGLYYRSEDANAKFVMNGFPRIFAEQLQALSKTKPFFYKNGLHFLPYDRLAFMQCCDDVLEKNKVAFYLHAHLHQIKKEDDRIVEVTATIHNHPVTFRPRVVVDTTGEAAVSRFAGLDFSTNETYQASAQVFTMAGIATDDLQALNLSLLRSIQKGTANNTYPKDYERLSVVPGSLRAGRAVFKLGLPIDINNDPTQITQLEVFARKAVVEVVAYLTANNIIFKDAWLTMVAPAVGIRSAPRPIGKIVMQKEDVLECRKVTDSVARGAWPIEFWVPGQHVNITYFALDDYYDIPGKALHSAEVQNLFFAGQSLSASEDVIASARVIGTCLATGYAAGRLAAGVVRNEHYETAVEAVQQLLF